MTENHNLGQPWAIFIGNDDAGGQFRNKWFFAESDGTLTFHINGQNVPGGGGLWLARTPFTPETNRWYHLAVTRQGDVFTTWIDGVAGATSTSSTVIPNSVAPLTIGQGEGLGYFWPGDATGFGVESKTNLFQAGWHTLSTPAARTNGLFYITDPITTPQKFYRLSHP